MAYQIYRKYKSLFGETKEVIGEYKTEKEALIFLTEELKKLNFKIRIV